MVSKEKPFSSLWRPSSQVDLLHNSNFSFQADKSTLPCPICANYGIPLLVEYDYEDFVFHHVPILYCRDCREPFETSSTRNELIEVARYGLLTTIPEENDRTQLTCCAEGARLDLGTPGSLDKSSGRISFTKPLKKICANCGRIAISNHSRKKLTSISERGHPRPVAVSPVPTPAASLPSHVQIEPTTTCNASCRYCYGRHLPQQSLDPEDIEVLLKPLASMKAVWLQGEGEPLLHKEFFNIVEYLHMRGVKVGTTTNGSLIGKPQFIEKLHICGLDELAISIDFADKERFEEIRVGLSFDSLISNIEAFVDYRNSGKHETPLLFMASVISGDPKEQVPDLIFLKRRLKFDRILFNPLVSKKSYTNLYDQNLKNRLMALESYHASMRALYRKYRFFELELYDTEFDNYVQKMHTCKSTSDSFYVDNQGNVLPCCFIKETEYSLGNLHELSLNAIWETDRYQFHRFALSNGLIPPACSGCVKTMFLGPHAVEIDLSQGPRGH